MKAAAFDYVRAEGLEHALELLAEHGGEAKLIAGGQSLVPMMAMRLVRPAVLVDIHRLGELARIDIGPAAATLGAVVRQRSVETHRELQATVPLLHDALAWVGHAQTRNRGTVGGSLVHADPSAELPLAAVLLGATLRLRSRAGGERSVGAEHFFLGPMATAVAETECLVAIDWPLWPGGGVATAFEETAMRHGDFAMAAAACQLQLDAGGVCRRAAIGLGGMSGRPLAFPELARELVGKRLGATLAREVAQAAVERTDPGADLHAESDYRRHLGVVLMTRALLRAGGVASPGSSLLPEVTT